MVGRSEVEQALRGVIDPCSAMSGIDVDIVDMGLVRTIAIDGAAVSVELQLTDGTCYFSFHLAKQAKEAVEALPAVEDVDVRLVAKELWSPDKMAPDVRRRLGEARARRRELHQIEPWARRQAAASDREHGAGEPVRLPVLGNASADACNAAERDALA